MKKKRCSQISVLVFLLAISQPSHLGAQAGVGVYTRTLEIEVLPSDVSAWETALASLAEAAKAVEREERIDWLVYRSGTTKYWIVVNRHDFKEVVILENLFSAFEDAPQKTSVKATITSLQATNFVVTMDVLWQQVFEWSTVQSMSTATNPLAVVTQYSVRLGDLADFDNAMREYVSFLKQIEYPYPVEGFRWRLGRPGRFWSVTFPDTWVNYYGVRDLKRFTKEKELGAELARLRSHLFRAAHSVSETYLTFAPELSSN